MSTESNDQQFEKKLSAPSNTTKRQREKKSHSSTAAIETMRILTDTLKPYELSRERKLETYQSMMLDDSVRAAFYSYNVFIKSAFSSFDFEYKRSSKKSQEVAEFLKYQFGNMEQSVSDIAVTCVNMIRDGYTPFEKIYKKDTEDYKGLWVIDELAYIPPLSLDRLNPYSTGNQGRKWTHLRQNPNAFRETNNVVYSKLPTNTREGSVSIPRRKVALCANNPTSTTPFGESLFDACYTVWREKLLLQDFTIIGVTKDFAGTPVMYIPDDVLEEAAANPSSDAAAMVESLKSNLANMNTGDATYTVLPSSTLNPNGTGSRAFEFKFLGVEGGGKNFNTEALVEQRKKGIHTVFGTQTLIIGESGGGSFNLAETKNAILTHYVKGIISAIEDMINKQVVPDLIKLNEFDLKKDEYPKFRAGDVEPLSADEVGKLIQRMKSVNALPLTKEVIIEWMNMAGFNSEHLEDYTQEELVDLMESGSKGSSRSGESMGSSGTGDSQSTQGGSLNMENKSLTGLNVDKAGVYRKQYLDSSEIPDTLKEGFGVKL